MPENGTHYLGVYFAHVDAFVERLSDDPSLLERVADAGKLVGPVALFAESGRAALSAYDLPGRCQNSASLTSKDIR